MGYVAATLHTTHTSPWATGGLPFDEVNALRLREGVRHMIWAASYAGLAFALCALLAGRADLLYVPVPMWAGHAVTAFTASRHRYALERWVTHAGCVVTLVFFASALPAGAMAYLGFVPCFLAAFLLFQERERPLAVALNVLAFGFATTLGPALLRVDSAFLGAYDPLAVMAIVLLVTQQISSNALRANRTFRDRSRLLLSALEERNVVLRDRQRASREQSARLEEANALLAAQVAGDEGVRRKLLASNEQLGQFAYAASHDLKEPLRSISSFVQLIRRRIAAHPDAQLEEYFEFVVSGAQRMTILLDDLLVYSRVGRVDEAVVEVDLGRAVALARYELAADIEAADAEIFVVGDLGGAAGPKRVFQDVTRHLLSNAVRFRAADRPLRIEVSATPLPGGWGRFDVRDNGIGIESAYRERVFNLFQRLHAGDDYPGSGVGLAFVRKSVELLGGEVDVRDNGGDPGVTFSFTYPTAAAATTSGAAALSAAQ